MSELEPITPDEAVRLYLRDRREELAKATIDSYRYKLEKFVEWCSAEEIDNLNSLSGRDLLRFKQARAEDLNNVSLKGQLDALRAFIRWCESIDGVEEDLHSKVLSPSLKRSDRERDELVGPETATDVLDHLSRFSYASRQHALLTVRWRCGVRSGTVRSFDLCDYDRENQWLRAKHRSGTPLKNQEQGERLIALNSDVCQVLSDYIDHNRNELTTNEGRNPLFTTQFGRISVPTIRETCYRWTHPCRYNGGHCPYDRDVDECQARNPPQKAASVCPSSRSPHSWRRGSITHFLTEDVPVEVVSDRMNVSRGVLEDHYDRRDEEVKVEQRRGYLDEV